MLQLYPYKLFPLELIPTPNGAYGLFILLLVLIPVDASERILSIIIFSALFIPTIPFIYRLSGLPLHSFFYIYFISI